MDIGWPILAVSLVVLIVVVAIIAELLDRFHF